jgi:hypothetical protein
VSDIIPWKPKIDNMLSIETLKAIQAELGLMTDHVVQIGRSGFVIAHTDEERRKPQKLTTCQLHRDLEAASGPPRDTGLYVVRAELDYLDPYDSASEYETYSWSPLSVFL